MRTQTLERTKKMVTLALLSGLLIVMGFTPLGYLKVSGLFEITFNAVPVAIAAITVGPVGGVVTGAVFGITSFIQPLQQDHCQAVPDRQFQWKVLF
ncbi:hypothetical protein IMSAG013_00002 [Clostridiales bacterium]|nr:hypothetical protein IMSAG013_00002 [Clostridiales bacterium]